MSTYQLPKITGLCHLFDLLGHSEANYKTQSLGSPCMFANYQSFENQPTTIEILLK